jgi:hypothetical protein
MAVNNPLSSRQWSKLKTSLDWSDRQLEFSKRKRLQAIRDFVGYHYSEGGSERRVPVPMLALAVQIYVRMLASGEPRVLCTTTNAEYKPIAANMELAVNQIPMEINLSRTIRQVVQEALFSIGVVKCGLHRVGTVLGHEYGQTFVDLVPLDDYFLDMSAKNLDHIAYEGNQYWLDYEEVKHSGFLGEEESEALRPDEYSVVGPAGENRAEQVSADASADQYRDRVWFRDVWLPKEGKVITMGNQTKNLLKVVDWTGPECGPYYKLGFTDVPGNLMPLPPVSLWRDLHELANKLFRKIGLEAESAKSVMGFQGGDDESVENFKKAADGEGIRYTGAPPQELKTSGVDGKTLAFYLQCRDLFSYYAGNLDSLGGLGNQSPTLGQDKLLGAAASAQMRDMTDRTADFIKSVFRALAHYEWHDPVKRRMLEKPIPGTDLTIPVEWSKQTRKGRFDEYQLGLDLYSLQDNSPGVRLQKLGLIMQQYIMPMAQQIQQDGGKIDYQKIIKLVAKYSDFPELNEIVSFAGEREVPQGQGGSGKPANTTRTYERTGGPGMSQQGADATLTQQLLAEEGPRGGGGNG